MSGTGNPAVSESHGGAAVAPGVPPGEPVGPRLGGDVEAVIGRRLKAMYDDVLSEPIPDRFMELLAKLENKGGDAEEPGAKR